MRVQLCCLLLIFAMVPCTAVAAVLEADHQLVIELEPATHSLRGTDRIRLRLQNVVSLNISLAEQARVERLSLNGAPLAFERKAHWITTELPVAARRGGIELELTYHVRYNDPLPDDPPSFDNLGSGVRGVITTHGGVFLMAGSRWHPSLQAGAQHFSVRVRAPQGLYAVTAGRLVSMGDEQGQSVTLWRVERCQEELPLCAGNYTMRQTTVPGSPGARAVAVRTFFTGGDVGLSQRYLDAAARHLAFYGELHGPYAFDGFAVVENFFPTGYGFPSFTLLGGSVLRLPFIPETSLRHEVAHCWWGNGVLVDYSQGNWCEGLTSYVADHQAKEELSQDEAREYRRRILSNYAQLVGDASVMPLKLFVARENPATQAVGYGKAMFVFHMLRKRMGDECFWEGLRDLYARKKFATAAWSDVLDAFVRQGGLDASDAGRFMEEWIDRTEAPRLHLEDVHAHRGQGGWQVSGKLCQGGPVFHLRVPVVIETVAGNVENVLELKEACGDMHFHSAAQPVALNVDPGADVFRLLAPGELPATVNSVKGAPTLAVVMSKGQPASRLDIARSLLAGMGRAHAPIVREEDLSETAMAALNDRNLLFFGYPEATALRALIPAPPFGVRFGQQGFLLAKDVMEAGGNGADTLFVTLSDGARHPGNVTAVFMTQKGASDTALAAAVRKVAHYGGYGCVAFADGANVLKLRWPAPSSPLRVQFTQ